MSKLVVTMDDIQRYKVLTEVIENRLTVREASEVLSLSYRHTLRLKDKVKTEGFEGLLRITPPYPPNKKITDEMADEILRLRRQTYYDFNIAHFRLFQDRLIKEMRLAGIKSYDEANKFLIEKFLPWYNSRYPHEAESVYMPLLEGRDLNLIFCIKIQRTVNNDNTISFNGHIIQIHPLDKKLNLTRRKVDVCLLEDNRVFVVYEGRVIASSILSGENKALQYEKKLKEILDKRVYIPLQPRRKQKPVYTTPANHPYRRCFIISQLQRTLPAKPNICKKEGHGGIKRH